MNLYRHYKNKLYRLRGIAAHSETLEDHVVYEPRYSGSPAKLWVRPRAMFDESVTVGSTIQPRFERLFLRVETFDRVRPEVEGHLAPLIAATLGQWDPRWFYDRITSQVDQHLQIGYIGGDAVGFKCGYRLDDTTFYSWIGGVLPDYRGVGIASELMVLQHDWCLTRGYLKVQTKSQNRWRSQILLNLRHGFDIVGHHQSDEAGPKIIFEKTLVASDKDQSGHQTS